MRSIWLAAAVMLVGAAPSLAQGPFVGGALTGDLVRFSRSESEGGRDLTDGGEALGFALRAGTPLGAGWGVDVEFARPGTIDREAGPDVIPLPFRDPRVLAGTGGLTVSDLGLLIYPPIPFIDRASQRTTTFSAGLWARQALSARAALVYSGGIGFHRTWREHEFGYGIERLANAPLILPRRLRTETTVYSTRPYAGIEARLKMTDRLELVPGVRLHGLEDGLLVRPAVGLAWTF